MLSRFLLPRLTFSSIFWQLHFESLPNPQDFCPVFTYRCAYFKKFLTLWSKTRRCFLEPCLQREIKPMIRIFDDSFLFISSVRLFCSSMSLTKGRLFRSYTRRSRRYWCCPASPLPSTGLDVLQDWLTRSMEANWGQHFQYFPSSPRLTRDSMRWSLLPAACTTQTRLWHHLKKLVLVTLKLCFGCKKFSQHNVFCMLSSYEMHHEILLVVGVV